MRKKAISRLMLWTLLLLASMLAARYMIETENAHYLSQHHSTLVTTAKGSNA